MPAAPLSFPPKILSVEAKWADELYDQVTVFIVMEGYYFNTRVVWNVEGPTMKPQDWSGGYWASDFPADWAAALLPYGYLPPA